MTNKELWEKIDEAVTEICRAEMSDYSNKIASVFYAGDFIARANGHDWIDGEGYSKAYWEANINGMKHNLRIEPYPPKVRAFYAKFFGDD